MNESTNVIITFTFSDDSERMIAVDDDRVIDIADAAGLTAHCAENNVTHPSNVFLAAMFASMSEPDTVVALLIDEPISNVARSAQGWTRNIDTTTISYRANSADMKADVS